MDCDGSTALSETYQITLENALKQHKEVAAYLSGDPTTQDLIMKVLHVAYTPSILRASLCLVRDKLDEMLRKDMERCNESLASALERITKSPLDGSHN